MNSYSVTLRKDVVARHRLQMEGPEGSIHSHAYVLEVRASGPKIDDAGFLIDIRELEKAFDSTLSEFRDAVLNCDEGFAGKEPTLENFSHVVWQRMSERLVGSRVKRMMITIWESPVASASYGGVLEG